VPAAAGAPARITVRPQGFVENATAPVTNIPGTYADIVRNAVGNMLAGPKQAAEGVASYGTEDTGLEKAIEGIQGGRDIDYAVSRATEEAPPKPQGSITDRLKAIGNILGGIGKTAQGAAEYVSAPVVAPFRSIVSQPVENVTGLPKEYTEFAAGLAAPIPKSIPGFARAPDSFVPPRPRAPEVAELRTEARGQYNAPEVTGAPLLPASEAENLAFQIRSDFTKGRVNPEKARDVYAMVDRLENAPPGARFSLDNLESVRQQLGEIGPIKDGTGNVINRPELRAAQIMRNRIDQTIREQFPEAAPTLERARGNTAAAERAETINRKEFRAELQAARANSGMNVSNLMRSRISDILLDPAQRRGFSADELALMERIVRGGRGENTLRAGSNILGGGGGAHAFYAGLLSGGVAPALGYGLKSLSNSITARNIERLNDLIRSRSPLGRQLITPMEDFGAAQQAFQAAPTPQNLARLTIASRNLSNNLLDAGIKVAPDRLIRFEGAVGAGAEEDKQ